MKLVTYCLPDSKPEIGAQIDDGHIVCLQRAHSHLHGQPQPFFESMLDFLDGGLEARDLGYAVLEESRSSGIEDCVLALSDLTLLSPVPRPRSIRDFLAFEDHIINILRDVGLKRLGGVDEWIEAHFGRKRSIAYRFNKEFYARPIYYKGNCLSVVGTDADVMIPTDTPRFDYELEFGIFIGKQGKNIGANEAKHHIGGYTIFNDFSARDIQLAEQRGRLGPAKGKDFDSGNAIGPYLLTPDEVDNPYDLGMQARVNGEQWSLGSSKDMYWSFEQIIEYVSRDETIYPGEFFGSGTCSGKQGKGCGLEHGKFLRVGDVIELEVDKLGVLRNTVVAAY